MQIPKLYIDPRDLLGNQYYQDGVGLKLVPHEEDPTNYGIVMVRDPNYGMFVCDVFNSNAYDLYAHRSGIGYQLVRDNIWVTGADIEDKILEKKAFRVGAGYPSITTSKHPQVVNFNIRNWNSSVTVSSMSEGGIVKSFRYEPGLNSLRVVFEPNDYASPRERISFSFFKGDTGESAIAYSFMV